VNTFLIDPAAICASSEEEDACLAGLLAQPLKHGLVKWQLTEKPEIRTTELGSGGMGIVSEGTTSFFGKLSSIRLAQRKSSGHKENKN
jgi:hypothetical protein